MHFDEVVRFWEAVDRHQAEREAALGRIVERHRRDGCVLAMLLNRGHSDLLENWIRSCERAQIDVRSWTILFAFDEETAERFRARGFTVFSDLASYAGVPLEAAAYFGDNVFRHMMCLKTAVVRDLLCVGTDVLFQDVDLVWREDPLPELLARRDAGAELCFMYDGPNPLHAPHHVNTGFFWLRNSGAVREFWEQVYDHCDEMARIGSQQRVVNRLLAAGEHGEPLSLEILPERRFANGHLFFVEGAPLQPPAEASVVHFSWTHAIEHKLEKYRSAGCWYL